MYCLTDELFCASSYQIKNKSYMFDKVVNTPLNPIQDGLFLGCSRVAGGGGAFWLLLPKIRHTYPTMMKLGTVIPYLRKMQKCINHVTHSSSSADISIFSPEISKFLHQEIHI